MNYLIDENNVTLDDLMCGYKIIQPKNGFRFSLDAVLLAHFTAIKKNDIVVDFCAGSGVIALLICAHNDIKKITCFEIQLKFCDLIKKSIELNYLQDKISVLNKDLAYASDILGFESVDVVTCNPPYLKNNTGKISDDESFNIARREVKTNLETVIKSASKILKNKGRFALVHLAQRADEIFILMKKYNIPVKRARLVQPDTDNEPNLILVEGIKNSSSTIKWLPTLNIYENSKYTKEIKDIYDLK